MPIDIHPQLSYGQNHESFRWFTGISVFCLISFAAYILAFVPSVHLVAASLAWLITVLCIYSIYRLVGSRSLAALLPLVYIAKLSLSWGIAPTYLLATAPDTVFITRRGTYVLMFKDTAHTMSVAFTFISIYCAMILILLSRFQPTTTSGQLLTSPRRSASWITIILTGIIAVHAFSLITPTPEIITYLTTGTHLYLIGIAAVSGASFHFVPKSIRFTCLVIFLFASVIYTLANSRNYVLIPAALFFLGFLTRPDVRSRIKLIAILMCTLVGSFFLLLANTTRLILGSEGFEEDSLGDRAAALSRWRDVFAEHSVLDNFLGRINYGAAWVAISQTPDSVSYLNFSLIQYLSQWFRRIFFFGSGRIGSYTGNDFLHAYGYRVREGVGIEPSMIAVCWVLGGWIPIVIGAIALALFHGIVMLAIAYVATRDRIMAAFVTAAALSAFLYGPTWGLIDHSREVILYALGAAIVYLVGIRPFVPAKERMEVQYDAIPGRC